MENVQNRLYIVFVAIALLSFILAVSVKDTDVTLFSNWDTFVLTTEALFLGLGGLLLMYALIYYITQNYLYSWTWGWYHVGFLVVFIAVVFLSLYNQASLSKLLQAAEFNQPFDDLMHLRIQSWIDHTCLVVLMAQWILPLNILLGVWKWRKTR